MSDFILPDIGEGIVECELVKWLVSEGDVIEEDQPVAEVMTDKALVEIPAPYKGRVTRLYYKEGDTAKVHAPLFELVDESESSGQASAASSPEPAEAKPAPEAENSRPPASNRTITPPKTLSCRISAKVSLSARWWSGALPKVTKSRKTSLL
ncbi:biotin/lipoyl-containing protein [Marinobacter adhaerens]|uniref:Protein containing biotin/lipoyl attachment domain n=1 Tax=Marinobacter adhaerens (strain DSM 23420 / HP15) TaxID=225937 RepID=E4PM68_MARAH|nr:biotin/lipoyl-containing protein [Marinobacter adhaerens]ADP97396.1 protein containing biotin/lipoyl attachment domain [Marinobacter adhaerens HP15]